MIKSVYIWFIFGIYLVILFLPFDRYYMIFPWGDSISKQREKGQRQKVTFL